MLICIIEQEDEDRIVGIGKSAADCEKWAEIILNTGNDRNLTFSEWKEFECDPDADFILAIDIEEALFIEEN